MGLLQKACETYDANRELAGVYREGHAVLPPVGHILTGADIEIMLNAEGDFLMAGKVPKEAPQILIPVTEKSMGRTGTKASAHPLCDELKYIGPQNVVFHKMYLEELEKWNHSSYSHPIIQAVYRYVLSGSILSDLQTAALIDCVDGKPKKEDLLICWRVSGILDEEEACWRNHRLQELYAMFVEYQSSDRPKDICMVTGTLGITTNKHANGVVPLRFLAKLISANDEDNFTYRGRFITASEAMNVSYTASQKAHNALRWLVDEQKEYYSKRAFLCWNPNGIPVPKITNPFGDEETTDPIDEIDGYKDRLKQTLAGERNRLPEDEDIVIAVFDAATKGRLSLNYYSEMSSSDFLERLYDWDEHCCWYFGRLGIQSPRLLTIINCAFGTERSGIGGPKMEVDERVRAQQLLRLVSCRINRAPMPADIKEALVHRASSPLAYEPVTRRQILSVACAVIKKYDHDRKGVNWEMALKPDKMDLSYQYGRLLAVLEKAETDTYDRESGRESNAVRMQAVFVQRPQYAASRILEQLKKAYFPRLPMGVRIFYERLIGEIFSMIDEFPEQEHNRPLQDSYLMGYYLQRNELWRSNKHNTDEQNEEEN